MLISIVSPRLCHGGAERVAVTLANGFVKKGHRVIFITNLYEEQTYILNESVKVYNLVSAPIPKIWKWISAVWRVKKIIKQEQPDVIIGIMSLCSLIARIAAIGLNTKVIATEHNAFERPDLSPMSLWDRIYKFHVSKIFKCMTVLSEADKKILGDKRKNVVVMPNPLSMLPIDNVPEKKRIVFAAGRVDNWWTKGFDVLIKAWGMVMRNEEFKKCHPDWRLKIAGVWRNPREKEFLDDIAKECGVTDSIDYLGFVKDMESLYKQSSIFVLSSRKEGFGLVLIEAMSQGCACVACDFNGRQSEIITSEKEGLICAVDDVDALACCIKRMIEDQHYREIVQKHGIQRSYYYSIDNTMNRWDSLIQKDINH